MLNRDVLINDKKLVFVRCYNEVILNIRKELDIVKVDVSSILWNINFFVE